MRLTCPNCRAQYEVDDRAIPEEGRDVQCSNCGQTWFQEKIVAGPLTPEHLTPEPEQSEPVVAKDESAPPVRGAVENSILNILREEAEREQRAREQDRATEAQDHAAEMVQRQDDLGLSAGFDESAASSEDTAAPPDESAATETVDAASAESGADMLRNGGLPDLEKINTTLQEIADAESDSDASGVREEGSRSSFSSGFALVIVLFGLALVSYSFAPTIARHVPAAEPTLASYVEFVDKVRIQTDRIMVNLVRKIEGE